MGSLHSQVYQFGKLFQSCKAAAEVSSLNYIANFTVFHITLYV